MNWNAAIVGTTTVRTAQISGKGRLLWAKVGWAVEDSAMSAILSSPLTGKTYKLPPRTVSLIEALAHEYGTQGRVLAAVAYMLSKPDPREGLTRAQTRK
jgi:hypothetical protein